MDKPRQTCTLKVLAVVGVALVVLVDYLGLFRTDLSQYAVSLDMDTWMSTTEAIPRIHMVVVADNNFAKRYKPIFDKMGEYAAHHGYSWTILGPEYFRTRRLRTECIDYRNFFFLKHCFVAAWMEAEQIPSQDAVFVFDADVVPVPERREQGLEEWADNYTETLVLYVRGWSEEIMAGNYLVRNTPAGRHCLRAWAHYEFMQPRGFSSADNGALHIHLLRFLGFEKMYPEGKCGKAYRQLVKPVTDLSDYWDYVACSRESLVINSTMFGNFAADDFSMRLLAKRTGFVLDHHLDNAKVKGPPFNHGVKIQQMGVLEEAMQTRYNISLPNRTLKDLSKQYSVSCGNHQATNCGECPQGNGKVWCNGDCHCTLYCFFPDCFTCDTFLTLLIFFVFLGCETGLAIFPGNRTIRGQCVPALAKCQQTTAAGQIHRNDTSSH